MSWFSARVIFRRELAECADRLWEETVFVIQADIEQEARRKLKGILKRSQVSFTNLEGGTVHWKIEGRPVINELLVAEITSGTEVYSRFLMEDQIRCLEEARSSRR